MFPEGIERNQLHVMECDGTVLVGRWICYTRVIAVASSHPHFTRFKFKISNLKSINI